MFTTYRTDLENVTEHPSGRYRFAPGERVSRLPLLDKTTGLFAALDQAHAEAYAKHVGARLPSDAEVNEIARQAFWISPVIVRETREETAERQKRGGTNPLERMATEEWARREHAGIVSQLDAWDGNAPVLNAGKHWEARNTNDAGAVNVGWDTDPRLSVTRWIQNPGRAHGLTHVDYSQTTMLVWDEDKPSDPAVPWRGVVAPTMPPPALVVTPVDVAHFMPDALTPVTTDEMFRSFRASGIGEEGSIVLCAHWRLETGNGKSMHRFNVGNIKHTTGDGRSWTMFRCNEIMNGKTVWFDPPHAQTWFRAYETLTQGVADYLAFLRGGRYRKAFELAEGGDAAGYARALKNAGYYTANVDAYTRAIMAHVEAVRAVVGFDVPAALATLGYPDVAAFQRATPGLVVDGIAGRLTIAELRKALAKATAR